MLEPLSCVRVVASEAALAEASWPDDAVVLRTAPDEVIVIDSEVPQLADAHAIVEPDAGWRGAWVGSARAEAFLASAADWVAPLHRPALAQGMVAQLPVKVWLEDDRVLFVVSHAFAAELEERLPSDWSVRSVSSDKPVSSDE